MTTRASGSRNRTTAASAPRSLGVRTASRIAVLYASGVIASGRSTQDSVNGAVVGSDTMVEQLERIRDDDSIKAIVLRVDSPGGSSVASDVIWRELSITRDQKPSRPLIASMSDLAASGGYYISMPAQVIVAQPGTLTGLDRHLRRQGRRSATRSKRSASPPKRCSRAATRPCRRRSSRSRPSSERSCMAYMQSFYDGFVAQGRGVAPHDAGTDSRRGAGTRLDRPPGARARTRRRARRPRPGRRHRQGSARGFRQTKKWSW